MYQQKLGRFMRVVWIIVAVLVVFAGAFFTYCYVNDIVVFVGDKYFCHGFVTNAIPFLLYFTPFCYTILLHFFTMQIDNIELCREGYKTAFPRRRSSCFVNYCR